MERRARRVRGEEETGGRKSRKGATTGPKLEEGVRDCKMLGLCQPKLYLKNLRH